MAGPKIVVVGSINMDLVVRAERWPKAGENVHGSDFSMVPGGKGSNQAVAAARLGASAWMIGAVGSDSFGEDLTARLVHHGVDTAGVLRDGKVATGTAMIIVDVNGENTIIAAAGANSSVSVRHVLDHSSVIAEADVLLIQLEVPYDTVEAAIRLANANNVRVVLDAGPACSSPREVFFNVDVLSPNEAEAEALLGTPVTDLVTAEAAGQELVTRGAGAAVIKLGRKGAMLVTRKGGQHFPGYEVDTVDTTAAGDAFTAALAVRLASGADIENAVAYANAAGAVAVTRFGAQPSAPSVEDIETLTGRPAD